MQEALSYDDILLVPKYSEITPNETKVESRFSKNVPLKVPIVSAPMDTVTDHRMAIAMALFGGLGIIHKNFSIEQQAEEVRMVKRFENGFIDNPAVAHPDDTVSVLYKIREEKGYKKIPVVDAQGKLVGIVTELSYFWPDDKDKKISEIMKKREELSVIYDGASLREANNVIREKKLSVLCVVDKNEKLKAIVTRKDLEKNEDHPLSNKDPKKHLYVGAAVGTGKDLLSRARALVEAGADVLVIDTAHGHSKGVIEAIKLLKKDSITNKADIVAGNVATGDGARDLIAAGADGVKIGMGPGSICTTRVIAGIGVPQISAIMDAVKGRGKNMDIPLTADGGIKYSGDITKALAVGADCVMLGGLLAGAEESPGETEFVDGLMYKTYRGMGSLAAMGQGSKDRYGQAGVSDSQKFVPEGIEGRTLYRGAVEKILYQLVGGLRSGMGYQGAKTIKELQKNAEVQKITQLGLKESHPHSVTISKDAPNYKRN
jgi:IMP dehydrogenase